MAPRGAKLTRNQSQGRDTNVDISAPASSVDVQPLPSQTASVNVHPPSSQTCSNHLRKVRGRSCGGNILKAIAKNGGKKLDIELPGNLARPVKNASFFATGIGLMIRRHAPVKDINRYDDIPETEKRLLHGGLMAWFNIKDFETDTSVKYKVDNILQTCYTHWRNEMHMAYKDLKDAGQDPKNACPFDWFEEDVWEAVCDSFEDPKYKSRSSVNQDNRKKLLYTHTSGSQSFHVRYHNMTENGRSHITNWRQCHTKKNGQMVNYQAELLIEEMENRKMQRIESGEQVVEEEILSETLGKRTGYSKGMGYGVLPPQSTNHIRGHNSDALRTAREQLQEQQSWLERQQQQIETQQQTIIEQNAKIEDQNSIIGEQNSTISAMLQNQKRLEEKVEKILAAFGRI